MSIKHPFLLLVSLLRFQPASATLATFSYSNATSDSLQDSQQIPQFVFASNMTRLAPVIALSHGGGPMPLLGDPSHAAITKSLQTKVPKILKLGTSDAPRAIVVITAHWSTSEVTISSGEKHSLLYDYYGFPPASYKIKHDAPGSPEVAALVEKALKEAGLACKQDARRQWDHGLFVPLKLIDPSATIPLVQISVLSSESPSQSFAIGRALATLRSQNIAIIGSGFATLHNLRITFSDEYSHPDFKALNTAWSHAVTDGALTGDEQQRLQKFEAWRTWPGSYTMHPRGGAEHFLPLIVCAGAAATTKGRSYADNFRGLDMWSYYWDEEEATTS